jgi:hypothetical protein
MGLDSAVTDAELCRHLLIGAAPSHPLQDLTLARRKLR